MILFKACPKCNGDMVIDGDEETCLQCGFSRYFRRSNHPSYNDKQTRILTRNVQK